MFHTKKQIYSCIMFVFFDVDGVLLFLLKLQVFKLSIFFLHFEVHDFKRKSKVKDGLPLILFPCVTANICNYLRYYYHHYNRLMASNFKLQHDHNNI